MTDAIQRTPISVSTVLAKSLQAGGESVALVYEGRAITRSQLRDAISRYIGALTELEIKAGARIAFVSENRPELIYFTSAALMSNICVVPLHTLGSIADFVFICRDAKVEALVFETGLERVAQAMLEQLPGVRAFSVGAQVRSAFPDLGVVAERHAARRLSPLPVTGSELSRLSYTGGTTGRPKGAMITHDAFRHMLYAQLMHWEWPDPITHLVCAPLSHAGASTVIPTLLEGGTLVILPKFDATQVLDTIARCKITSTLLVPSMIYKLLDQPNIDDYDLSSIQTIFYGASAISKERLTQAIGRFGHVFYQFYAQAEAPMVVTGLRKREHDIADAKRLTSCGKPLPWVDVALLDTNHQVVATGQIGELCVRGPILMEAYLGLPRETAEAFEGGWLHTGDMAVQDDAGFLYIVDRKKDMIISGGFNVYSKTIEDLLRSHPGISDAAVYGVPHAQWGEAVHAVVVVNARQPIDVEDLRALVLREKGKVHVPKRIEVVDAIPLTSLGKPDKALLRARTAD